MVAKDAVSASSICAAISTTYTKVSHRGKVFLDTMPDGSQIVTHATVLPQHPVPPSSSPYELVIDEEDGFGALVSEDGYLMLEEWLPNQLLIGANGIHYMQYEHAADSFSLSNVTQRHQDYIIKDLTMPFEGAPYTLRVFKTQLPRSGSIIQWSLFDVFKLLGLTCCQGVPSKWVYNSQAAWRKSFGEYGITGALTKSSQGIKPEEAFKSLDQFLPSPAIGTFPLTVLAYMWAHASPHQGGLRDGDAQVKSLTLLRSLVAASVGEPYTFIVKMSANWEFKWPRPDTCGAKSLEFQVGSDGFIDLTPLQKLADSSEDASEEYAFAQQWWQSIFSVLGRSCKLPLATLLCGDHLGKHVANTPIWLQLLSQVCARSEDTFVNTESIEFEADSPPPFRMEDADADADWSLREIDKQCVRHVVASTIASRGQRNFGMAFDKANTRGFDVQNGFVTYPNNVAFEFVPQVCDYKLCSMVLLFLFSFFIPIHPSRKTK